MRESSEPLPETIEGPGENVRVFKRLYAPKPTDHNPYKHVKPESDQDTDTALMLIADGASVTEAAVKLQVNPTSLWAALSVRDQDYARAREIRASEHARAIEHVMMDVADGTLSPEQGRVIMAGAQWLAARLDGKRYNDKIPPAQIQADAVTTQAGNILAAAVQLARQAGLTQQLAGLVIEHQPEALPSPPTE